MANPQIFITEPKDVNDFEIDNIFEKRASPLIMYIPQENERDLLKGEIASCQMQDYIHYDSKKRPNLENCFSLRRSQPLPRDLDDSGLFNVPCRFISVCDVLTDNGIPSPNYVKQNSNMLDTTAEKNLITRSCMVTKYQTGRSSEENSRKLIVDNVTVDCQLLPRNSEEETNHLLALNRYPKETKRNRILKLTIDNLRTLPKSGKLDITIELPDNLQNLPSGKCNTNVAVNQKIESVQSPSNVHHLNVSSKMRPRANSDSKLQCKRHRANLMKTKVVDAKEDKTEVSFLPEIKIDDFSCRTDDLEKRLENESADLKKDLTDKAEFFSQINYHRRRANTCPDKVLKSLYRRTSDVNDDKRLPKVRNIRKRLMPHQLTFVPHTLSKVVED